MRSYFNYCNYSLAAFTSYIDAKYIISICRAPF
nr:MAG TPA: hypothetical protein [Caudoviricetes sp.]